MLPAVEQTHSRRCPTQSHQPDSLALQNACHSLHLRLRAKRRFHPLMGESPGPRLIASRAPVIILCRRPFVNFGHAHALYYYRRRRKPCMFHIEHRARHCLQSRFDLRSYLKVCFLRQRLLQCISGAPGSDLSQSPCRVATDHRFRSRQRLDQRRDRRRIAQIS